MKISKSILKSLIKECLIEILAEGLGAEALVEATSKPKQGVFRETARPHTKSQTPQRNPALDHIIQREAGQNDIMRSILEDTAQRSLPQMMANDHGDQVMPTVGSQNRPGLTEHVKASPEDVFGSETVDRWNTLAF
jgi:hypothetical protein